MQNQRPYRPFPLLFLCRNIKTNFEMYDEKDRPVEKQYLVVKHNKKTTPKHKLKAMHCISGCKGIHLLKKLNKR